MPAHKPRDLAAYRTLDPSTSPVNPFPRLPISSVVPAGQQACFIGNVLTGLIGLDVDVEGAPMSVGGVTATKGLGARTPSLFSFDLGGQYVRFKARVAVDGAATNAWLQSGGCAGTLIFRAFVDNNLVWESGVMTPATAPRDVDLAVLGAQTLCLETNGTYDGYYEDRADWSEARLTYDPSAGQFSGNVFRDYNSNGVRDTAATPDALQVDRGVRNITVTVYADNDVVLGSTRTDASGGYVLALPANQAGKQVRVEFTNFSERFYEPSFAGPIEGAPTQSGSSVQFVTVQSGRSTVGVDLALVRSREYCSNNPMLAASCFSPGNPLSPTTPASNGSILVNFPHHFTGDESPATNGTDRSFDSLAGENKAGVLARLSDFGAIYGLAARKASNQMFASALVKRHAGLGSLGLSGIYSVNLNADGSVRSVAPFVRLDTLGIDFGTAPSNAQRGILGLLNVYTDSLSQDTWAYTATGKVGIGDIDMGPTEDVLFFTNLFDGRVYGIRIADRPFGKVRPPGPQDVLKFNDPGIVCKDNSPARGWGLHMRAGRIYAGYICTAEEQGKLIASGAITRPTDVGDADPQLDYVLHDRAKWANTPFATAYSALEAHVVETLVDVTVPSLAWSHTFSTSLSNYGRNPNVSDSL